MCAISRRSFLQSSAAVAAASRVLPQFARAQTPPALEDWPENGTLIPDTGWRLWVDKDAEWKNDAIFLPEQVTQDANGVVRGDGEPVPVHPPTGGWAVLAGEPAGSIPVVLPSTVEQHFWGKYGAGDDGKPRPYTPEEYRYAADDPVPQNGAFFGVSWWWREIEIPEEMQGKRVMLHVRGAHLRAEVYLNEKLVGYSIMEELPFEAELTHVAKPGGKNLLAIRITNPFGRFDWVDGLNAQWGAVKIYRSHGFGGMDRGLTISAHDAAVRIKDAWVLNTPDPRKVQAYVALETNPIGFSGTLVLEVVDRTTRKIVLKQETGIGANSADDRGISGDVGVRAQYERDQEHRPQSRTTTQTMELSCPDAPVWDLASPRLYDLRVRFTSGSNEETRTIPFGFRSFTVDGLGSNALFRLNGQRMKIYTAISWGYWGINGMWPTPQLAVKEVTQAKKLGLTCLNFHRNLAKEEVLRAHDRLGLLRYMEPGAGKMAIGKLPPSVKSSAQASGPSIVMEKPTSEADKFAQRYMFTKCVEMVKAFRSHPCVIEYCLQNEIGADLKNPDTLAVLKAMHDEDPSRCVVLNDGFVAPPRKAAQAWYAPWGADLKPGKLHRSDEEAWGDW